MTEPPIYAYHQSGRRGLTTTAGVFCAAMVGFGLWKDAPYYAMLPMLAALIMTGWLLITNPQSGTVLTRAALRYYHGRLDRTVALPDIAAVARFTSSDGPDEVMLMLHSGEKLNLPSQCFDEHFVEALKVTDVSCRTE